MAKGSNIGKGGGQRKVYWETLCPTKRHGKDGYKSTHGWFFVSVSTPKTKPSKNTGCPGCWAERNSE